MTYKEMEMLIVENKIKKLIENDPTIADIDEAIKKFGNFQFFNGFFRYKIWLIECNSNNSKNNIIITWYKQYYKATYLERFSSHNLWN